MDPEKLKVVDLRKELQQRGLDTKGNKAVLVQRLREALEEEGDSSEPAVAPATETAEDEEVEEEPVKLEPKVELKTPRKERAKTPTKAARKEMPSTPARRSIRTPSKAIKEEPEPEEEKEEEKPEPEAKPLSPVKEVPSKIETSTEMETETRGEKRKREDDEEEQEGTEKKRREDSPEQEEEQQEPQPEPEQEMKEVKERPAPREDEPDIDYNKVHLSWLDSDLNLKINPENFVSARPINSHCFGYLWAGARASHGISKGKVCFEVKITEEIPWEDPADKMQEKLEKNLKDNKFRIDRRKENAAKKTEQEEQETKKDNVEENGKEDEEEEKAEETQPQQQQQDESETQPQQQQQDESDDKTEEVKPEDKEEEKPKLPPIPTHYFRVGFSLKNSPLQLGEAPHSYAYENTGKFLHNKQFKEYGPTFGAGDVIGSFLSIDTDKVTISYTKNGELVGEAISLPKSELPDDCVLLPHVLCRNFAYEVNFGGREAWFEPLKDYPFVEEVKDRVDGPRRPEKREECEVILMVGLPGSGKTHWVNNHLANSKDKLYTVIGNNPLLIDRMTVEAEPIKSHFPGSWKALVDQVQKCLNQFIDMAGKRRRNYIIDQTNFNSNAQRRKLRSFEGFQRKAVILVCNDEEHKRRLEEQHNDGKMVPESTMYELKAAMELPEKCDFLDDIIFGELDEEESRKKVKEDREDANKKGYFKRQNVKFDNRRARGRGRLARGVGFPGRFQRGGPWRPVPPMWGGRRGGPPPRGQGAWRPPQRDQRGRGFAVAQSRPAQPWNGGWGQNSQGGNKNGWNSPQYSQGYGMWNSQQTGTWKYPQSYSGQAAYSSGQSGYNSGQRSYNNQQYGSQQQQQQGYGYGNNYGSWNQGYGQGQQQQSWNYYGQYGQNQSGWGNQRR